MLNRIKNINIIKKILNNKKTKRTSNIAKNGNIQLKDYDKFIIQNPDAIVVDVRNSQEYNEGHLRYAINIPFYEIEKRFEKIFSKKDTKILVYCKSGVRSKKTEIILRKMGYTNVYNLENGIDG